MSEIAVVLCTRNGEPTLGAVLEGYVSQETSGISWEMVIVDNGSTDETEAVVRGYQSRLPITLVYEPIPGKNRGLMRHARRIGGTGVYFRPQHGRPTSRSGCRTDLRRVDWPKRHGPELPDGGRDGVSGQGHASRPPFLFHARASGTAHRAPASNGTGILVFPSLSKRARGGSSHARAAGTYRPGCENAPRSACDLAPRNLALLGAVSVPTQPPESALVASLDARVQAGSLAASVKTKLPAALIGQTREDALAAVAGIRGVKLGAMAVGSTDGFPNLWQVGRYRLRWNMLGALRPDRRLTRLAEDQS